MPMSEAARVRVVESLGVMGSAADPEFDRLARLVGHVAQSAYAHVCFIDGTHQFIKASEGEDTPRLSPREHSICTEAVLTGLPLVIPDLRTDSRRQCRDVYERYGLSSYASLPVRLPSCHVVGAVAVMSRDTISLSGRQWAALGECADLAGREALIKRPAAQSGTVSGVFGGASKMHDALRAVMTSHIRVLRAVSDGVVVVRADGSIAFANAAAERILGRPSGSLLDAAFEDEVLHRDGGSETSEDDTPVAATLRDGAERLVRSAPFLRSRGDAVRVGYVVSPILTDARAIGAVVIFRALDDGEFSNGVDLRNTLREVAKLKEQLAKAEAARRSVAALPLRALPPLATGISVDFPHLLEAIKDERAAQSRRDPSTGPERFEEPHGLFRPLMLEPDEAAQRPAPLASRGPSRTERWLASGLHR